MSKISPVSRLLAQALAVSTLSLQDLADDLGVSSSALRHYRLRTRTPPADLARRIARALRQRARRLDALASRLEQLTLHNVDERGATDG